jgi:hypothetical protein
MRQKPGKNVKSVENGYTKKQLNKTIDKLWSEYVRKRDGKCIICGSTNHIQAHHIFSRRYMSLRYNVDNGVTLCFAHHHHLAHSLYEEFRDKIISILGQETYDRLKKLSQQITKHTADDLLNIKQDLEQKLRDMD